MKSYLYHLLLWSALLIRSCVCKAEESLVIWHVFVELTPSSEIENLLKSAILRQLRPRQLTDVEIEPDEQSSEVILRFHVISTQLQNGTRMGYVISLVNTSRFQIEMIESPACSTMSLVVSDSVWMMEVRMSLVQVEFPAVAWA